MSEHDLEDEQGSSSNRWNSPRVCNHSGCSITCMQAARFYCTVHLWIAAGCCLRCSIPAAFADGSPPACGVVDLCNQLSGQVQVLYDLHKCCQGYGNQSAGKTDVVCDAPHALMWDLKTTCTPSGYVSLHPQCIVTPLKFKQRSGPAAAVMVLRKCQPSTIKATIFGSTTHTHQPPLLPGKVEGSFRTRPQRSHVICVRSHDAQVATRQRAVCLALIHAQHGLELLWRILRHRE